MRNSKNVHEFEKIVTYLVYNKDSFNITGEAPYWMLQILKLNNPRFNAPPFYCKILGIWEVYFPTTSTFLVLMLVAAKVNMLRNPFHSLSSSNRWIHVGCVLICLAGLVIPTAPFFNLGTYIYCPKRMTCTMDFYPDWDGERAKMIFITWATIFCCVVPLLVIAILSYYIIKKVRASRQFSAGQCATANNVRDE